MRASAFLFFFVNLFSVFALADVCPQDFIGTSAVISLEGRFVNREFSRVHTDIIWRHHPNEADTFDITLSGKESYRYISTPDFRYLEFKKENVRRQMAMHHLQEYIGESPLKWDDVELLARGNYLCYDSLHNDSAVLYTAYSQAWYSIVKGLGSQPDSLQMNGPRGETRKLHIHSWKEYSAITVPTITDFDGNAYTGSLWTRTAFRIYKPAEAKPFPKIEEPKTPHLQKIYKTESVFWNRLDSEVEVPLKLQMH